MVKDGCYYKPRIGRFLKIRYLNGGTNVDTYWKRGKIWQIANGDGTLLRLSNKTFKGWRGKYEARMRDQPISQLVIV